MDVLVDYSNVPRAERSRGPTYVIDKVLYGLGLNHIAPSTHVSVRLYDGWYDNQTPTRRAQDVSAELLANYPATRVLSAGTKTHTVIVKAEPAYSMKLDPATHIWHTFRLRGSPWNLSCSHPTAAGCALSPCALVPTHDFLSNKRCPAPGCTITPSNLVSRSEQKLVDAMLAADLFYLYLQKVPKVAVVTSDDDLWPAIKTVLDLGMHVVHVHPLPGHTTPTFYSRGPRPTYTEIQL